MKELALLDSETLDRELGYLRRLFEAGLANLDDLLCDLRPAWLMKSG